jgi:hypothetical protein
VLVEDLARLATIASAQFASLIGDSRRSARARARVGDARAARGGPDVEIALQPFVDAARASATRCRSA